MAEAMAETVVSGLRAGVRSFPDRILFTWLVDGESETRPLTAFELDRAASDIAAGLRQRGASGERVVLACEPGIDFICSLLGCFYAGAVAVPVSPPRRAVDLERCLDIARHARAAFVITSGVPRLVPERRAGDPLWLTQAELALGGESAAVDPDPGDLALIQYTSGSTGKPRGVLITHANLAHNSAAIHQLRGTAPCVGVNWLPPYHDMGLVGAIVHPIHAGIHSVLMSPQHFLQRPARWLEAVTRYRATASAAPDFALRLCADRISESDRERLDLSSWRLLICGAEPVRRATWDHFCRRFSGVGLDPDVLAPCYGLAESTLLVTGRRWLEKPRFRRMEPSATSGDAGPPNEPLREVASCGKPLPGQVVRIVDEALQPVPDGVMGEILISGPSVASGYFEDDAGTRAAFDVRSSDGAGPWLRTGDLGLLDSGDLFVVGRIKHVMKLRGRSVFAEDVESTVSDAHPALRVGGVAAFSIDEGEREELVVLAEVELAQRHTPPDEILAAIRTRVGQNQGLYPSGIGLVIAWALPRTSSGKLRRAECRRRYRSGAFQMLGADTGAVPA